MSIKQKTVQEILENRKRLLQQLAESFAGHLEEQGVFRSCLNCDHWSGEPNEICNKFNARPPAKIIVLGCSEHSDEIPF